MQEVRSHIFIEIFFNYLLFIILLIYYIHNHLLLIIFIRFLLTFCHIKIDLVVNCLLFSFF